MTQQAQDLPVSAADIEAAAKVVAPFAVRTPLLSFPVLDERTGTRVFLKPKMLQRTGSFKFRGAFNKLSSIPQASRGGGVVAFSSGNHAQGVAAAAKILDMHATILMPSDAPASKRERTKSYGAEVVLYDRDRDDREAMANGIAEKRGATLVRPYDDPFVIAGQGTVGREIAEDLHARGLTPDIVVAPAGGGGLIAGVATAVKARFPNAEIIVAEPAGYDDHALSLKAGRREPHPAAARTICDALMSAMPGELTFAINKQAARQWRGAVRRGGRGGGCLCLSRTQARGRARRRRRPRRAARRPHRRQGQERRHRSLRRQCRCRAVRKAGGLKFYPSSKAGQSLGSAPFSLTVDGCVIRSRGASPPPMAMREPLLPCCRRCYQPRLLVLLSWTLPSGRLLPV